MVGLLTFRNRVFICRIRKAHHHAIWYILYGCLLILIGFHILVGAGYLVDLLACNVGRMDDTFAIEFGQVMSGLFLLLLCHILAIYVRQEVVSGAIQGLKSTFLRPLIPYKLGSEGSRLGHFLFKRVLGHCCQLFALVCDLLRLVRHEHRLNLHFWAFLN